MTSQKGLSGFSLVVTQLHKAKGIRVLQTLIIFAVAVASIELYYNCLQADLALTRSVSSGAYTAIAECRQQFRYETWSCPEEAFYLNEAAANARKISVAGKDFERNNNVLLNNNDNNGQRPTYKTSRSLKFKALRKNNNRRRSNNDQDENRNNFTNNNNNNNGENNNNNNKNSNNQIQRRKARKRVGKHHEAVSAAVTAASEDNGQLLPDWKGIRRPTTRETAFVHAITAAGITHTLTKNCSGGDFPDCVCDNRLTRRQLGWEWGGCSDNYHFGSQVAKQFLDTVESGANSQSLANLHNNEAGRIVS